MSLTIISSSSLWIRIQLLTLHSTWGNYPVSLMDVRRSTLVRGLIWNNVRIGTWGHPPTVKAGQLVMWPLSCRYDLKLKYTKSFRNEMTCYTISGNLCIFVFFSILLWKKYFHITFIISCSRGIDFYQNFYVCSTLNNIY